MLRFSKHPFTLKKFVLSVAIIIATLWFIVCLPKPLFDTPYSHILLDKNNNLLQAKIAADGQWRFPYQQNDVPTKFEKAIITFEDKRFYNHFGVDVMALGRALWLNTKHNKVKSGGSTISMQVIRLSRNKPRNVWQKCIELILSVRLEIAYSKQQIIKLYAAHAPFGGNVVGLDAAAWRYFGREASQLSWGEAASLAILPNNPSIVRPGKNKTTLLHKRNWLLDQMHNNGVIDKQTCELAKLEPVPDAPLPLPEIAPHALGSLMQKRIHPNNNAALITSTLDKHLQQRCNEILFKHAELFASNGIHNAAALIMEVESGDVLAYVGNLYRKNHPDTDPYVDVIPAPRSPGSTLKPLLYAAVLQDGLVLPDALIPDVPTQVAGYSPKNFDLGYDGAVPASKALARSLNVPMVRLLQQYKVERFYDVLKKLNIHSLNKPASHYGLSLILGGGENSMWEISGVYSSLARILNHYTTNSSRYSTNDLRAPNLLRATQHETKDNQYTPNFHVNAGSIYATFNAMNEVMRPGDELLWTQFSSSQKIAWKTGTSFGFRDGWAIGVTPKHVICVWVGNADGEGRPGLTGVNTAAPIMFELFKLLPPSNWFEVPYDDMVYTNVCLKSGFLASDICEVTDSVLIPISGIHSSPCPYHQLIHLDATERYRVNSSCESVNTMKHQSWFILPPSMEWYYKNRDHTYQTLPPYKTGCSLAAKNAVMEMIYPKQSSAIYVPIELNGETSKTVFEVAHRNKQTTIYWHLDDEFIGTTREFHQMGLHPSIGKHTLILIDEHGDRLEQHFNIIK